MRGGISQRKREIGRERTFLAVILDRSSGRVLEDLEGNVAQVAFDQGHLSPNVAVDLDLRRNTVESGRI